MSDGSAAPSAEALAIAASFSERLRASSAKIFLCSASSKQYFQVGITVMIQPIAGGIDTIINNTNMKFSNSGISLGVKPAAI